MKHSRVAILGLAASLFAATALNSVATAADAPAAPSHIAVINLREAYTKIDETTEMQNRLKGLQGELETMQKSHQAQLQEMQQKMGNLKAESDAHSTAMEDFDTKSLAFAMDEKKMQVKMVREQNHQLKAAYDAIQAATIDVSKKKSLDLVLVNSSVDLPANGGDIANSEQLANLIFNRSIMYVGDKVDITAEVIAAVNAAHKAPAAPAK